MTLSRELEVYNVSLNCHRSNHGHRQQAQKFGEVRQCGFHAMQADRQTKTYSSQYFALLP